MKKVRIENQKKNSNNSVNQNIGCQILLRKKLIEERQARANGNSALTDV